MADLATLESALRKAHAAGDTAAAKRFADAIRGMSQVDPREAMTKNMGSLQMQMDLAGAEHQRKPYGEYVGQSLKEMAIPAITTAAGSTLGLPGAMIGAGTGELLNQAMGISGGSVIPEANVDAGRIGIATVSPAIIPGLIGLGRVAKGVGGKIRDVAAQAIEPLSETGRKAILERYRGKLMNNDPQIVQSVIDAAKNAKAIVPGSNPTVAESISHIPEATGIAAYEQKIKGMEGISPAFSKRQTLQEEARSKVLAAIARTPAALKQALDVREGIAGSLYKKAAPQIAERDATFNELMQRPSMQRVMKQAADIAKEAGRTFKIGQDIPEQVIESPIVSATGQKITKTIPAQVSKLPVESLHDMKMAMDDLIKDPDRFGIGAKEAAGIAQTRKELVDWIGSKSQDYDLARQTYRLLSVEPNRMQVGKVLKDALDSPLESVGGISIPQSERAGVLAKAVQDAPRTIKNAMGRQMFDRLDEVLSPSQVQGVNNVVTDLARHQAAKKLAAQTQLRGTDAIPGDVGLHLPPMLSRPAMISNWALGKLGQDAEARIAERAAVEHLDPKLFAGAISDLPNKLLRQPMPSRTKLMLDAIMRKQAVPSALIANEIQRQ